MSDEMCAMTNQKHYGYICTICREPIKDPQPTEHTDDGLAHMKCCQSLRPAKSEGVKGKKSGIKLIAKERQRQIDREFYNISHDDRHTRFTLTRAAIAYADVVGFPDKDAESPSKTRPSEGWPSRWRFKPSDDPVRNLVKAGALIAAEIDRLNRKT